MFSALFRKKAANQGFKGRSEDRTLPVPNAEHVDVPDTVYDRGDFIGKAHEVLGVLGVGGFSVVYLVYSHETDTAYALKTLRDQYLQDGETREQFRKEAKLWIDLGHFPYLVSAHFIDELSGRLYIGMEYVAPAENGLNSLEGYLEKSPPDLQTALKWSIQFCHGMEYANSKGIRSHRDVKPANIMIAPDGIVKITDFGFADVIDRSRARGVEGVMRRRKSYQAAGFGTPNYMPPEQFLNATRCDARSDIYSFGVVLYQMASQGKLPFIPKPTARHGLARTPDMWREMHWLHTASTVPPLNSPLFPIIQRCLQKEQGQRYLSFRDLRLDLETLYRTQGGEVEAPERPKEVEAWELYNKAFSLANLGNLEEAIQYYDRVLLLEPKNTDAWNNRGVCCKKLGRLQDALTCYENAIVSEHHNASAWANKGNLLQTQGLHAEALVCLNKAVDLDPSSESAWLNKAIVEDRLGLHREAVASLKHFIDLEPVQYASHLDFARKRLAELQSKRTG
jgi:serine/threonine protein kinase